RQPRAARLALCPFLLAALAWPLAARADDWPQWLGPKRDGVWREAGILDRFPKGWPKVVWRKEVRLGYAGPAVATGKVYVTDFVLDKDAGGPGGKGKKARMAGKERVLCSEVATRHPLGKQAHPWRSRVSPPAGPRTTPTVSGNRVYTLGTMGDLYCLDTRDGKVIWSKNFPKDYKVPVPMWGFAAHPLLDG